MLPIHGGIHLVVVGLGGSIQQGGGGHQLANVAIRANGHLEFAPGLHDGCFGGQTFDGGHLFSRQGIDGGNARAHRLTVD